MSNDLGEQTRRSEPTAPVAPPEPPTVDVAPTIYGTHAGGETLSAYAGEWTGYPTAFEYQWQRCDVEGQACEDVPGESSARYHVPRSDEGQRLRIVVTARNAGGTTPAMSDLTRYDQKLWMRPMKKAAYLPG